MSNDMCDRNFKIGISGFGFVGSALFNAINKNTSVHIYDPGFVNFLDSNVLLDTDVVFICVGTPDSIKGLDNKAVQTNLNFLSDYDYKGLVVIKSTILPDYFVVPENLNVLSNPEFLNEVTANDDFQNQELLLIGGRIDLCNKLKDIYDACFNVTYKDFEFVSFNEALQFKYIRNMKIAYDVMFLENIERTIGNYRKYLNIMKKIPVKIDKIHADGKPGYGGHCLPKDINAFDYVYDNPITKYLKEFNEIRDSGR